MAILKSGTSIEGSLIWHQGNLNLYPMNGDILRYKQHRVYTEADKPTVVEIQAVYNQEKSLTNENLNDLIETGVYKQSSDSNALTSRNYPVQTAGSLEVVSNGVYNSTTQTYKQYNSNVTYQRSRIGTNSTWTEWARFYSEAFKPSKTDVGLSNVSNDAQVKKSGDSMTGILNTNYGITMRDIDSQLGRNSSNPLINSFVNSSSKEKLYLRGFRSGTSEAMWHETIQSNEYRIATGASDTDELYKLSSNGTVLAKGAFISKEPNGIRLIQSSYGFMIRNDNANTFFMVTNKDDPNGGYGPLRPFWISNSTGVVTMDNGARISTLLVPGASTLQGNVALNTMRVDRLISLNNSGNDNWIDSFANSRLKNENVVETSKTQMMLTQKHINHTFGVGGLGNGGFGLYLIQNTRTANGTDGSAELGVDGNFTVGGSKEFRTGNARYTADGNIFGSRWGNKWLDAYISDLDTNLSKKINDQSSSNTIEFTKYVPKTTTINGKALSGNISLNKSDVSLSNVDNVRQTPQFDSSLGTATNSLYAKVAVGNYVGSNRSSLSIIVTGGSGFGTPLQFTDYVTASTRNLNASSVLTDENINTYLEVRRVGDRTATVPKLQYGLVITATGAELWVRYPAYVNSVSYTVLQSGNWNRYFDTTTNQSTEPEGLIMSNPYVVHDDKNNYTNNQIDVIIGERSVKKAGDIMTGNLNIMNPNSAGSELNVTGINGAASVYLDAKSGSTGHLWFRGAGVERGVIYSSDEGSSSSSINIRAKTSTGVQSVYSFVHDGTAKLGRTIKLNTNLGTPYNDIGIVMGRGSAISETTDGMLRLSGTTSGGRTIELRPVNSSNPAYNTVKITSTGDTNGSTYIKFDQGLMLRSDSNYNGMLAWKAGGIFTIRYRGESDSTNTIDIESDGNISMPSIQSKNYRTVSIGGQTLDLNTLIGFDGVLGNTIKYYGCMSQADGDKITNKPSGVGGNFILEVRAVRSLSATDYYTIQTLYHGDSKKIYTRWVINGTWTAWSEIVSGVQPVSLGGTGATDQSGARNNIGLGNVSNDAQVKKSGDTMTGPLTVPGRINIQNNGTLGFLKSGTNPMDMRIFHAGDATRGNRLEIADDVGFMAYFERHPTSGISLTVNGRVTPNNYSNFDDRYLGKSANAVSATKLANARTIAGVSFDGTANIAIPAGNVGAYTKAETDAKVKVTDDKLASYVPITRTVNGKALSANISITGSDVGLGNVTNVAQVNKAGDTMTGNLNMSAAAKLTFSVAGGRSSDKAFIDIVNGNTTDINAKIYLRRMRSYETATLWHETLEGNKLRIATGSSDTDELLSLTNVGLLTTKGNGSFNDVQIRSDIRLKTNIAKIDNSLEKVNKLSGYTYDKKMALIETDYSSKEVGLIAQEVESVLPEAISELEDGTKTIRQGAIIALLIESVNELTKKVKELEAKNGSK